MKDIDFDELDQAVSSVLKTPAAPEPAESKPEKTEPEAEKSTASEAEQVDVTTSSVEPPVAATPETPAPAAKTPLAIKRRGQFMDVVHPSSDMTGKPGEAPAPAKKVSIQPISTSVEPDPTPGTELPEAKASAEDTEAVTETPQAPVETVEPAPADKAWPDPLDVMETQEEETDTQSAPPQTVEDTPVDVATSTDDETTEEAAPTTPFLTDTKVEKRPLDAFAGEEAPAEVAAEAPVAATGSIPPELQPEVVAVEANPSDKVEEEAPEVKEDVPAPAEDKAEPEASFNTSIPQQYAASEAQAEDDHSIFDTKEYHQPITPTKSKKRGLPGWLVATLVILLLAGLGAAGGYFWFYYGL